ncbi:MAG: ABC transporter ATP-binding protein [Cyanobacteria bacterium J06628_6]
MAHLIEFRHISKVYGSGNTEVRALWDVNMTIDAGEYCSIMGPSGSGKSTAMNVVGCLDRPSAGKYLFDGQNVAHLGNDELALIRNRKIGFVFQQFHLLPQLTALENVSLPMIYAGVPAAERVERSTLALQQVGLGDRLSNKPTQLSGGQQQRVAIARAIVNRPLLLLADEPTGALDTQTTREVMNIFAALNRSGITVVMVTHEPEVARLTDRIIWFRDGEVLNSHMSPDELGHVTALT